MLRTPAATRRSLVLLALAALAPSVVVLAYSIYEFVDALENAG